MAKLTQKQLEQRRATRAYNLGRKRLRELAHALIDSGFSQQARRLHPDTGGSNEGMHELAKVRDTLHAVVGDGKTKRYWYSCGDLF